MTAEPHDEMLSDFALMQHRGSKRLVIALSGINSAPGRYSYFATFRSTACDTLLLNCPDNGWFFNGLPTAPGQGDFTLKSTLTWLEPIVARYDQVLFLGGSMGAYGALLYGAHFPGAEIFAMSPEIYPGIRRGFVNNYYKGPDLPPNLSRLFTRPDFRPYIVAGEKKFSDLFCLTEVTHDRVFAVRNAQHQIPSVLHSFLGTLGRIVDPIFERGVEKAIRPLLGNLLAYPDLVSVLYLCELGRVPLDRAIAHLEMIPRDSYLQGYLALLVSERFERQGNLFKALHFARLARDANPGDLTAHLAHDRLTAALHGTPPPPHWTAHACPHFVGQPLYDACVQDLQKLHGADPAP